MTEPNPTTTTSQVKSDLPNLPPWMTEPLWAFFKDFGNTWHMLQQVVQTTSALDSVQMELVKVLEQSPPVKKVSDLLKFFRDESKLASSRVFAHTPLLLELILCRSVDSYLAYIAGMLGLIFRSAPATLPSERTIKYAEVLAHDTLEGVVDYMAEVEVQRLAYQGMRSLAEELRCRPGLVLYEGKGDLATAIELVQVRNLIVHNRGVVNRRFLERVGGSRYRLAETLRLDPMWLSNGANFLFRSAVDIEGRATSTFSLPRPRDPKSEKAPPNY
jgi:hypothetical protein